MNAEEIISALPLIAIARGLAREQLRNAAMALARGGFRALEITMNTPGAAEQLREATEVCEGQMVIGAGTVTNTQELERALGAGARFIVTPCLTPEVLRACVERNVPAFPGALTPSEIYAAWEMGAMMIKIFPADAAGPEFIRALKESFPRLKLLPTGGLDLEGLPAFVSAGADGFGIGTPLLKREAIERGDWQWIEERARAFVDAWRTSRAARPMDA
jgi:2-dehydro-3-deoxyphosphogluconate aldolase/(4S)-4-hydroxy-2-oxoglutarate aldolase